MNEDSTADNLVSIPNWVQRTSEERAEWARLFCESGLSLRKFSARHGLHWYALWRWVKTRKKELEKEKDCGLASEIRFTEIKMPAPTTDWVAEITFPNGRVLRLTKEAPVSALEQLLRVC